MDTFKVGAGLMTESPRQGGYYWLTDSPKWMRAVPSEERSETNVGTYQEKREHHAHSCKVSTTAGELSL